MRRIKLNYQLKQMIKFYLLLNLYIDDIPQHLYTFALLYKFVINVIRDSNPQKLNRQIHN